MEGSGVAAFPSVGVIRRISRRIVASTKRYVLATCVVSLSPEAACRLLRSITTILLLVLSLTLLLLLSLQRRQSLFQIALRRWGVRRHAVASVQVPLRALHR